MEKINVISCTVKMEKPEFTVYEIKTSDGRTFQSYKEFESGEHEVEITPNKNPAYPANIKKVSAKPKFGGGVKDYTFEKRKAALEIAASLVSGKSLESEKFWAFADKCFDYLNKK